jgi:hypothetical protein
MKIYTFERINFEKVENSKFQIFIEKFHLDGLKFNFEHLRSHLRRKKL